VNTPHPDLETLAELADRDVTPASETAAAPASASAVAEDPHTAEILAHVSGCAACTADLEALRRVRETLRALPPVPMPPEVAERIEAALLAARTSATSIAAAGVSDTVVPLRQRSNPTLHAGRATSRWRTLPYGAAASIVVVLAVIVVGVVSLGHRGSGSKKSASPAAAAATSAGSLTIASGTNYTADDLRSQVTSVVTSNLPGAASDFPGLTFSLSRPAAGSAAASAPAAASSAAAAATSAAPAASASAAAAPSSPALAPVAAASPAVGAAVNSGPADQSANSPLSAITAPAGPLADPAALAQCVQILAGKAEQPLLVDYATFNGAPSTIIVLPDPDVAHKLDVYVIADTASCANQTFTFETFIGPTAGP
jgi:hypothetical protein